MRKLLVLSLLLIFAVQSIPVTNSAPPDNSQWTVMLYMAGGYNDEIGNQIDSDLREIESAGYHEGFNIIALSDGTAYGDTSLRLLGPDGFHNISLGDVNSSWSDELDMSDWHVLRDFLSWSMQNYPANHSMLIFWGHGQGWKGMPADENHRNLEFSGVSKALAPVVRKHGKMDIIGFDQCNMAMYEVFAQMAPFAKYAVASEKEEPISGWPYDRILSDLYMMPSSPSNFSRAIVEDYISWSKQSGIDDISFTMSALNLSYMPSLEQALSNYSSVLRELLPNYKLEMTYARDGAQRYPKEPYPFDLYNITERMDRELGYPALHIAGMRLRDEINRTVMEEGHYQPSEGENVSGSHGMSIWFPTYGSTQAYREINSTVAGAWADFLDDYYRSTPSERPEINASIVERDMDGDGANESFSIHVNCTENLSVEIIHGDMLVGEYSFTAGDWVKNISYPAFFPDFYRVAISSLDNGNVSNFTVLNAVIEGYVTISGRITDYEGNPVDAEVILLSSVGNMSAHSLNGIYSFRVKVPYMAHMGGNISLMIVHGNSTYTEHLLLNDTYVSADYMINDTENTSPTENSGRWQWWIPYIIAFIILVMAIAGAFLMHDMGAKRKRMERLKSKPKIRKIKRIKKVIWLRTFVDREEEITELNTALRNAEDGAGSAIFLTGEDGVGKSALMNQFRKVSNARFIFYNATQGEKRPYEAILRILDSMNSVGISHIDLNYLGAIKSKEEGFYEAFRAFSEASREMPLVVYISGAQWLDNASIEFLQYLIRGIDETKVLLVISAPQEELEDVEGKPHPLNAMLMSLMMEGKIRMIKLERFDMEKTRIMLSTILESDIPDDILEKVYEETQGLPILIEEIANKIRLSGKNVYEMEPSEIEAPRSVADIMGRRLEKLDNEEKSVAEWASVLGMRFPYDVLMELTGLGDSVHGLIYRLIEDKILKEEGDNLEFDHPQIRKMIYESLGDRAREMHAKAAQVIERMHPDDVFSLAHHYCNTGNREKCVKYSMEAAKRSEESYSPKEAIEYYRMAEKVADERELPEIYISLARNLKKIMEMNDAIEYAKKAAEYGGEIGYGAHLLLGHIYLGSSRWDEALEEYERSLKSSSTDIVIDAYRGIGKVYWRLGKHDKAAENLEKAVKLAEESKNPDLLGVSLIDLANVHSDLGNYEKAISLYDLAIKYLESVSNLTEISRAYNNMGEVYKYMGDMEKAIESYKKSLEFAESTKEINHVGYAVENIGTVYVYMGRFEEAMDYLSKAYRIFSKTGDRYMISGIYMAYGIMYGMQKKWDKAEENFKKSIELLEEIGIKYDLGISVLEYGKMLKEKGDERAEEVLRKALDLFVEIGSEEHMKKVEELLRELKG